MSTIPPRALSPASLGAHTTAPAPICATAGDGDRGGAVRKPRCRRISTISLRGCASPRRGAYENGRPTVIPQFPPRTLLCFPPAPWESSVFCEVGRKSRKRGGAFCRHCPGKNWKNLLLRGSKRQSRPEHLSTHLARSRSPRVIYLGQDLQARGGGRRNAGWALRCPIPARCSPKKKTRREMIFPGLHTFRLRAKAKEDIRGHNISTHT